MKRITVCCFALLLVFTACNDTATTEESTAAKADSPAATAAPPPAPKPDSATMAQNWQNYMTPGEVHKMMASWNGTWTATMNMWEKPGAQPMVSTAKAVNKTIFNGLYQVQNVSGNVMGMPFEGMATTAYDNHKKMFISTWIDNMGSGIMKMEGTWDAASKSVTQTGKMVNPATGGEEDFKQVMKVIDDNNQVMEMYAKDENGNEFKTMEIKYTRSK